MGLNRISILGLIGALLALAASCRSDSAAAGSSIPFPVSCGPDFRSTLEAPAGRQGFLTVGSDGRFHWSKTGRRARFWGVNVSSTRLNIPPEQIEQVVDGFARAGLNLVRLEAIDNRNCLLGASDARDSRHFDPQYLDRLDRWMDALRRHGIYYYLDLLDFRTFKDGDGVLNADSLDRGGRPYAVFSSYLIQLQQEYAAQLLTHRNPYSGLRPVDDPALAMIEICNEHGFFLYPEKLETLVEPYRSDLRSRWSQWLLQRYGSRAQLEASWGSLGDFTVLRPDEDPLQNSVDLPLLSGTMLPPDSGVADVRRAAPRRRDGVQFLSELQRAWFRTMRNYVRSLGVKVPVTAVVSSDVAPDVASVAQECDFTSENWYGEGVTFDTQRAGVRYYGNRNTLRDDRRGGFAPFTAALRWQNRPVVVREWATTWPNRWRANSVPEALAYAALQDIDACLLFGYQTNRAPNGADADALNDFAFQCDPTVWGLYALAGRAFLRGDLAPARNVLTLSYTPERLFAWPNNLTDLHRAAYAVRLRSRIYDGQSLPGSVTPTRSKQDTHALEELLKKLGQQSLKSGVWHSDTGQIVRRAKAGMLEVRGPRLRMLAGELVPNRVYDLGGGFRFVTPTAIGALLVLSLDGNPLERSRHLIVKMVSRAENTGQSLELAPAGSPGRWILNAPGKAPILTYGKQTGKPARVWMPGSAKPVLTADIEDGTWELEVNDGRASFTCDTPNILWQSSLPRGDFGAEARK